MIVQIQYFVVQFKFIVYNRQKVCGLPSLKVKLNKSHIHIGKFTRAQ